MTAAAEAERLFGKDILFDGDLRVSAAGDYVLLEGEEVLRQAIRHRLATVPGEYKAEPTYGVGVHRFVERRNRPDERQELEGLIRDQLSLESRINRVNEVVVEAFTTTNPPQAGIKIGIAVDAAGGALRFKPLTFTDEIVTVAPVGTDQRGGSILPR